MCGRFASYKTGALRGMFGTTNDVADFQSSYSIAPTNHVPIVIAQGEEEPSRCFEDAKWDFPRSPYSQVRGPSINAKIEKLTSTWAGPFASARCILPMVGYYEWTGTKDDRIPHFIHGPKTNRSDAGAGEVPADIDFQILAAAGMYARDKETGQMRFAIITREATDASGELHTRMPAFLTEDTWQAWLDPRSLTPPNGRIAVVAEHRQRKTETLDVLHRASLAVAKTIETYVVDKHVNNVKTVNRFDPDVVRPV